MHNVSLLRLPAVVAQVGFGRASIYARISEGLFVRPIRLGGKSVAWPSNEVGAYVAAKIAGASDDELRQLVKRLEAERTAARVAS